MSERRLCGRVGLAVVFLPFLALLLAVVSENGWVASLDEAVAEELHEAVRDSPATVDVLEAVTFFGASLALYPVVIAAAILALAARRRPLAVFVVVTAVTGGILNHLVKDAVGRTRPVLPDPVAVGGGPSFPSGHAMNSAIVFAATVVVLAALTHRWRGPLVAATVVVLAIGFTRVALGVHYLTDVVAGWSLGLTWVAVGAAFLSWPGGPACRRPTPAPTPRPAGPGSGGRCRGCGAADGT